MQINETEIPGCFEILPVIRRDERGAFVKTLHEAEFAKQGLSLEFAEEYYSHSEKNVLRGLHFQTPPEEHRKMVYCVVGAVMDVVLDLRVGSPTYGKHASFELSAENARVLYLAPGLAHGFFVTSENATLMYKVSTVYAPEQDAGIRWDSAGINWPVSSLSNPLLSERDRSFPGLDEFESPFVYREAGRVS